MRYDGTRRADWHYCELKCALSQWGWGVFCIPIDVSLCQTKECLQIVPSRRHQTHDSKRSEYHGTENGKELHKEDEEQGGEYINLEVRCN